MGEVIKDYTEKSTIENQYPILTSSQQKGIVLQDEYFSGSRVSKTGNIGYFILPRGYFAYRNRSDNDTYVFNRNDCVDKGIISRFYPVFSPYNVDSDFLLRRLNNGLKRELVLASEGTGQHVLSLKKFKDIQSLFPKLEEQQKIGDFFQRFDTLIALHQRKLNHLKEQKKGLLQKMFPKKGEVVPEVRFPGYTDAWEQRKLGEIAEISTGFPFDSDSFSDDGNYLVITNGNIQDNSSIVDSTIGNHISVADKDIISKYVLNVGDILVTMDGTVGRTAKVSRKNMILAQRVGRLKVTEDSEFVYQLLNSGNFSKNMLRKSHGGTIKHISLSEIASFETLIPGCERERFKIGNYFRNLDLLIALHQRKLEHLKLLKKGLLQQMFV